MLMQVEWPGSKMKNGPMRSAIREKERADRGTKLRPIPVGSSLEDLQSPHINYSFFISGIQVLIRVERRDMRKGWGRVKVWGHTLLDRIKVPEGTGKGGERDRASFQGLIHFQVKTTIRELLKCIGEWSDGSVVKSPSCSLEDLDSVPSMHTVAHSHL